MLFDALFWGLLAPALATAALTWAAGRGGNVWRDKLRTLAPAAGIGVAFLGLVGWPVIPPREALHLLPWFLLAPLALARPWFLVLAAAALPAALAWKMWARDPSSVLVALAPVWALGSPLVFLQTRGAACEGSRPALSLCWTVTAAAAAGVFFLAHSAKLAQLSGAGAACAGTLALLALVRGWGVFEGVPAVLALSHLGLISLARLYAYPELPLWPQTLGLLLLPAAAVWGLRAYPVSSSAASSDGSDTGKRQR